MRLILFPSLPFPSPECSYERTGKTSQIQLGSQVLISHVQSSILTLVTVTQLHIFNASTKICRAKKKNVVVHSHAIQDFISDRFSYDFILVYL